MKYSETQDKLIEAFRELALAKQEFILMGGTIEFEVHRNELILKIKEGSRLSFPFVIDSAALEKFKKENPQHEYKE